jgi:hypothetical protein
MILAMRSSSEVIMAFDYSGIPSFKAMQLQRIARRVNELLPTVIPIIIQIGEHLAEAKAMIPHGHFGAYCKDEMDICNKSAQNYMNLAKLARTRDPGDLAKLPARAAYKLAAKDTPETVISEVLSEVRAGRSITEDEVKERIGRAKGKRPTLDTLEVDKIADLLLESLDAGGVREVESFLRCASKATIKALSGRLREALDVDSAPPARNVH